MALDQGQTTIRKILANAREHATPIAAKLADAWSEIVPRIAEDMLGLTAAAGRLRLAETDLRNGMDEAEEGWLIVRLERNESETGLLLVDPASLAALIEVQTSGRVNAGDPVERVPTATDAIMVADVVDAWLAGVDGMVEGGAGFENLTGYRFAGHFADTRAVLLSLPEGAYRTVEIAVNFQEGTRLGILRFLLPLEETIHPKPSDARPIGAALAEAVMDAPAKVEAVLFNAPSTLGQVSGFKEGDMLRVPLGALAMVRLQNREGIKLAQARLGQLKGMRAVRVTLQTQQEDDAPFAAAQPSASLLDERPSVDPGANPNNGDFGASIAELGDNPDAPDLPPPPPPMLAEGAGDLPPLDSGAHRDPGDLPPLAPIE